MVRVVLPRSVAKVRPKRALLSCPGHRSWVRRHHCSVPGCRNLPIECAHVRSGTGAGLGRKPSDKWVISLCQLHHREQHQIGEPAFETKHSLDMRELAREFARLSPHWKKLAEM